jgi:hypothetical protein
MASWLSNARSSLLSAARALYAETPSRLAVCGSPTRLAGGPVAPPPSSLTLARLLPSRQAVAVPLLAVLTWVDYGRSSRGDATQGRCRSQGRQPKIENIAKLWRLCHAMSKSDERPGFTALFGAIRRPLLCIPGVPVSVGVYVYGNKRAGRLDEQIAKPSHLWLVSPTNGAGFTPISEDKRRGSHSRNR